MWSRGAVLLTLANKRRSKQQHPRTLHSSQESSNEPKLKKPAKSSTYNAVQDLHKDWCIYPALTTQSVPGT